MDRDKKPDRKQQNAKKTLKNPDLYRTYCLTKNRKRYAKDTQNFAVLITAL